MNRTDVIVGIDGTAADAPVVRWAAAEAARSGARLRVLLAVRPPLAWERAERAVADAVAEARAHRPGLDAGGRPVAGEPAAVLTDAAAEAALVVVGSHGRTALAEALHGATGTRVAMRAPGLVAMVRGRADAAHGPVIAGVDGSHTDNRLLATAFEHAARRGCEVVAVRVVPPPVPPWGVGIPPLAGAAPPSRATLLAELTDDLQRWQEKYPGVPATARVPSTDPAAALLDASGEAQLLVIGGRPHGPAAALLAGSVGQRLLYHVDCPLLIVHPVAHA